ncbi:MAG: hypothetical protein JWP89_4475 [Schlesneria sp.]|nr:hypothetical protein [Schlesneria sp.]
MVGRMLINIGGKVPQSKPVEFDQACEMNSRRSPLNGNVDDASLPILTSTETIETTQA